MPMHSLILPDPVNGQRIVLQKNGIQGERAPKQSYKLLDLHKNGCNEIGLVNYVQS